MASEIWYLLLLGWNHKPFGCLGKSLSRPTMTILKLWPLRVFAGNTSLTDGNRYIGGIKGKYGKCFQTMISSWYSYKHNIWGPYLFPTFLYSLYFKDGMSHFITSKKCSVSCSFSQSSHSEHWPMSWQDVECFEGSYQPEDSAAYDDWNNLTSSKAFATQSCRYKMSKPFLYMPWI